MRKNKGTIELEKLLKKFEEMTIEEYNKLYEEAKKQDNKYRIII